MLCGEVDMSLDTPEGLLTRDAVAVALTEAGFPTSASTLAAMKCRGGGPPFKVYGRTPLYQLSPCLDWAKRRSTHPNKRGGTKAAVARQSGSRPLRQSNVLDHHS